jgi:DNA helicase-2/ATP-dependent DNA helicase PcrA
MSDASVAAALRSDHALVVVEAPAGCGKTYQAADYAHWLAAQPDVGQALILTHTHAACDVFRARTAAVHRRVHITTIDGLVAQVAGAYHLALGLPSDTAGWVRAQGAAGFELLAEKVSHLLAGSKVVISALVSRHPIILCDEHQDANAAQHSIVMRLHAAGARVRIFADPMQAIYVKGAKARAAHAQRWRELCGKADRVEELDFPHRWADGSPELGQWILRARLALKANQPIDVRTDRPDGLVVHLADNLAAARRGGVAFEAQDIRPVRKAISAATSMMILAGQNDTVLGVSAFLGRSVPIWEGHTRDALPKLVAACIAEQGNPVAIAGAFTDFVQFVCKGFGDSAFADLFRAEVAAGAVKQRTGKPAQLQALARLILASPDHVGVARALELLALLRDSHPQFSDIEIDLRREFREAVRLATFADPALGLIEITRRRTAVRSNMPSKFISTVHKAKGLEADHVLLMPCDKAHFGDAEEKRCLLYVALSRAKKSLTIVTSMSTPSPWLIGQ